MNNHPKSTLFVFCAVALLSSAPVAAQKWTAIGADGRTAYTLPGLPSHSSNSSDDYEISIGKIADYSEQNQPTVSVEYSYNTTHSMYQRNATNGAMQPFAVINANGAVGPNRSGAESTNVFRSLFFGTLGSNASGSRVFLGRAGQPNSDLAFASYGIWRWNPSTGKNNEIARAGASGATLGPNLGTSVFLKNSSFSSPVLLKNNKAVMHAKIVHAGDPDWKDKNAIVMHTPGTGNQTCALEGSNTAATGPNLASGTTFNTFSVPVLSSDDRVYTHSSNPYPNSAYGIWEVCNGSPMAQVLTKQTGAKGPLIAGKPNAQFTQVDPNIYPTNNGKFYFLGRATEGGGGSQTYSGLFLHTESNTNIPVALNKRSDRFGPQFGTSQFQQIHNKLVHTAGDFVAFSATISLASGETDGIWRVNKNGEIQLVLLKDYTGGYYPSQGRKWKNFYDFRLFPNGDIAVFAINQSATDTNDSVFGLWLIKPNSNAKPLLIPGTKVQLPNASGNSIATVKEVIERGGSKYGSGNQALMGWDDWATDSGFVVVKTKLKEHSYQDFILNARVYDPSVIFGGTAGGFE